MQIASLLVAFTWSILTVLATVSPKTWAALNETVNGRLIQHAPFARACFKLSEAVTGTFNASECTIIQQNYDSSCENQNHCRSKAEYLFGNLAFRVGNAGSYEGLPWEGCPATSQNCFLDTADPTNPAAFEPPQSCHQGGVPSFFINVTQVSDVQAAFDFAKMTGVELVVKNTGHDYQGRSARPGSLAIWMNNLKTITYNSEFKPTGCSTAASKPVVTLAPGVEFNDLYDFGEANNLTIPGGACGTVGAVGGYVTGGGHSALTNTYGLAVDRALEYRVVVPTGQFLVANECQNTDLYFALRGGGGGTFGVVMEVVTLAFPRTPVQAFILENVPVDSITTRAFLNVVVNNSLKWAKAGWGGYIFPNSMQYLNPLAISGEQATKDMAEMRAFARSVNATIVEETVPSFVVWYRTFVAGAPFADSGSLVSYASRIIPTKNYETQTSRAVLLDALVNAEVGHALFSYVAGTPFSITPDGMTSVTPAWRDSLSFVIFGNSWNFDTTPAQQSVSLNNLTASAQLLRDITPESGTYINESDLHEPDFEFSFWGHNYQKLLAIKNKYDPFHLLDCWHCVGWKGKKDPIYQCYI